MIVDGAFRRGRRRPRAAGIPSGWQELIVGRRNSAGINTNRFAAARKCSPESLRFFWRRGRMLCHQPADVRSVLPISAASGNGAAPCGFQHRNHTRHGDLARVPACCHLWQHNRLEGVQLPSCATYAGNPSDEQDLVSADGTGADSARILIPRFWARMRCWRFHLATTVQYAARY